LFHGGNQQGNQLSVQVMAIIFIIGWSGGLSFLIMAPLRKLGMLRLDDEIQDKGADIMEHSPVRAYGATGEPKNQQPFGASPEASKPKTNTADKPAQAAVPKAEQKSIEESATV